MRRASPLLLALLFGLTVTPVLAQDGREDDPGEALQREAWRLYNAKEWDAGAVAFLRMAESSSGIASASSFYNVACCLALDGDGVSALVMLERAIDAGYVNHCNMSGDSDLSSLRDDPRFESLLSRIEPPPIVITENVKLDPADAELIYEDAENFVRAMKLIDAGGDPVATLEVEYFAKATPGLKQMVKKYPFTAESLAEAIEEYPDDYHRVAHNISLLKAQESKIRAAFARYFEIAPDTVFAPTYYLVDRHRGIGSGSPDGQLITIERRTDESIGRIETLLVHELVHFQQLKAAGPDEFYAIFGPKKTLLALTIREGTAEFFADHATGRMTQHGAVEYCLANEQDVWRRFQEQMHDDATAGWMWSKPEDPEVPKDLAYIFGSRIVRSYYDRAADKRTAVREILAVVDYPAFLERSGYGTQFDR